MAQGLRRARYLPARVKLLYLAPKNNYQLLSEPSAFQFLPVANEFESTLQNRLVVEKVMQALADVTPKQRLMFLLKHHEGLTYDEIAKEFDCSLGTVKKSVSRTVIKLRDKLKVNEEPGDYISCAATQSLR